MPVSDVDRAKAFYLEQAGFVLDVDYSAGEDFRVVQLTPPGSACSITLIVPIRRRLRNPQGRRTLVVAISDWSNWPVPDWRSCS